QLAMEGAGGAQDVDRVRMPGADAGAQELQRRALFAQSQRAVAGRGAQHGEIPQAFDHRGLVLWNRAADLEPAQEARARGVKPALVAQATRKLAVEVGGQ